MEADPFEHFSLVVGACEIEPATDDRGCPQLQLKRAGHRRRLLDIMTARQLQLLLAYARETERAEELGRHIETSLRLAREAQ